MKVKKYFKFLLIILFLSSLSAKNLYSLENKIIVKRGEVITSEIIDKSDLDFKNINFKIKTLLRKTRDTIKLKGSIVNEITTRGNFIKKIRESLKIDQNIKYRLEVVSLKESKTADPIIVELNISKL